jgi:hypothetical protein
VTWGQVQGATGYILQYATDRVNWTSEETTTTSANVQNLFQGVTYFFRVYSKGQCGQSAVPSQIVESVVTQVNVVPVLPTPSVFANCDFIQLSMNLPAEIQSSNSNYVYTVQVRNNLSSYETVA